MGERQLKARPRGLKETSSLYKLKPTIIPDNFVLITDTREQKPLFARMPKGLTIQSAKLDNGDYSVKGFESIFAIERKQISDLFPYCSTEREKTVKKMERFKEISLKGGWVGLVIENRESDIYQFQHFTKVHPEVIRGALTSFSIRYGVHVYFAGNRDNAARWVLDHAVKFYNVNHEL